MEKNLLQANLLLLMKGMSEGRLAKLASIPKTTINRILSGRTPDPRAGTLVPIAQYFGISLEQLIGVEPLPASLPFITANNSQVQEQVFKLPFIEMHNLYDMYCNRYNPQKQYSVLADEVIPIDERCFFTKVTTTAMQPKFYENDRIIINPSIKPRHKDYVVYYNASTYKVFLSQYLSEQDNEALILTNITAVKIIKLTPQDICIGVVVKSESYLTLGGNNE